MQDAANNATDATPYDAVVLGRRSIRGFRTDPVPKALLKEVLEVAMRAPSSYNSQPWNFFVLSGSVLDTIRKGNVDRTLAGAPDSREFRKGPDYAGVHRERQIEVAKQLFGAMGIAREDKDRRQDWVLRGFRQFDAPASIVVTYDRELEGGDIAAFDCGAVTNAIVNAAWARGLGCVINSQGILQSPVLREHAKIPENQMIQIAIAIGFPDEAFPANAVVSHRKPVEEAATFLGFDD